MAERKVLLLVGNGFNYLLLNIIKEYSFYRLKGIIKSSQEDIEETLKNIIFLYSELKVLDILRVNHNATDWEEGLNGLNKDCDLLVEHILPREYQSFRELIKASMKESVKNKMKIVADKFNHSENHQPYKDIKRIFKKIGPEFVKRLESNNVSHLSLYTTNYDSLLDSLLTDSTNSPLYYDYFNHGKFNTNLIGLSNPYISLTHIHGSFKYYEKNGLIVKVEPNERNENPVIILSSSESKEDLIKESKLLSRYWNKFTDDLKNFDRVIILGNSLNSEPHIIKAIKENFDRIGTELVICSNNCDSVERKLKDYYNQFIYKFSTDDIIRDHDLLNLFYQLFNEDLENCSFCDLNKAA